VIKLVIDTKTSPAFGGASFGTAGQYETIAGHVFGELDPNDPHNTIINDINLAPKNAGGKPQEETAPCHRTYSNRVVNLD
jgi:hypothetical protein